MFGNMRILLTFLILIITYQSWSQSLEIRMDSVMQTYVDESKLHGCVTFVQKDGQVLLNKAYGFSNLEKGKALTTDAIFNIASMAKIVTAVGALILYERGEFLLDDPIEKYLPELQDLKVLENVGTDSAKQVALNRSITIRDLFRHTAGFSYAYRYIEARDEIDSLYVSNEIHTSKTSSQFLERISRIPLKYQPGSQWEYSYSIDVLGFLVERVSQMTLHDFLKQNIFDPLQMNSTGFYLNEKDSERLSSLYTYSDGELEEVTEFTNQYSTPPTLYSGGGGLGRSIDGAMLSSTSDFASFCNMLLNYGKSQGLEILKPQTVELLISNQIGGINERSFPVGAYGLGVGLFNGPNNGKTVAISWTGAFNTIFVINYKTNLISIFMTQHEPWGYLEIMDKFLLVIERSSP